MATFAVNSQNFFNRKKIDDLFDSLHHAYFGINKLPSLKSGIWSVAHSDDILIPVFRESVSLILDVDKYREQIYRKTWMLFIDSSKRSLKCIVLHNTNKYASIQLSIQQLYKKRMNQ